jgi:uncharacterized membrane protein YtjA (UPF0391 family)
MRPRFVLLIVSVLVAAIGFTGTASASSGSGKNVTGLSVGHGIAGADGFPVDVYVVRNLFDRKRLDDVTFGTVAQVFDKPGLYYVAILPADDKPFSKPILQTTTFVGKGQNKTVFAYVAARPDGTQIGPRLGVFSNDVSRTDGNARVTVRHLAVAPTVGVSANGSTLIPAFSNGQSGQADVPADTYGVAVTAPNDASNVLFGPIPVSLAAGTNTIAYAVGVFPSTFTITAQVVPTR